MGNNFKWIDDEANTGTGENKKDLKMNRKHKILQSKSDSSKSVKMDPRYNKPENSVLNS